MGTAKQDAPARELYETGTEPEYRVTAISKWEDAGGGMIRLYLTNMRGRFDRLEYTALIAPADLAKMGRQCLAIAAEFHTAQEMFSKLIGH